jgi:CubicO group peptidase (beta-lactamase class C family)
MIRPRSGVILLLSLVFASNSFAQSKLDSLLNKLSEKNKFMGSVTICKNDQLIFNKAYGFLALNSPKATTETKYRIGSISKMFTATMIFQLIEEKKLSLNTKLSNFFSQIPNADKITISNMLDHRSGIFNITNDSEFEKWHIQYQSEERMLDRMKAHSAEFEPDEKTEYSNSNFILLGYIIEKITGKSYANNLRDRIADKIGLLNTYYGGKTDIKKNECYSFSFDDGSWWKESETDMSVPGGAGAIVSTTNDLTHFITSLFQGKLIGKSSLDSMTTITEGLGRGIFIVPFGQRKAYGHNGGIDKFVSGLSYFPDDSVAFAICTNGLDYSINSISIGILKIFYKLPYEIPSLEEFAVDLSILKKYEGVYSCKELPMKVTIGNKNKKLTAQATGQSSFALDALSNTEFKFDGAGIKLTFPKEKEMILKQGGQDFTFSKE